MKMVTFSCIAIGATKASSLQKYLDFFDLTSCHLQSASPEDANPCPSAPKHAPIHHQAAYHHPKI